MPTLTAASTDAYVCRTCDTEFTVPSTETPVCCPVCRMNRIGRRE